jgi:hypothetical protein
MMRVPPMQASSLRALVKLPWWETPQEAVSLSLRYRRPLGNRVSVHGRAPREPP